MGSFQSQNFRKKGGVFWSKNIYLQFKKLLLHSGQSFHYHFLLTDTAIKVQAAKDKARQANDTANDVLAQIKDLNRNLLGLRKNYSKLTDDVAKTNAVVKDPVKNSKIFFRLFGGGFFSLWFSFHISKWNRDTPEFHLHSITTVCWDKRIFYHFYFLGFLYVRRDHRSLWKLTIMWKEFKILKASASSCKKSLCQQDERVMDRFVPQITF